MDTLDIIAKKRDGQALSPEEITWFIQGYVEKRIPDYQAAAWLMAVYLKGMTREETVNLTLAMVASGETIDLSDVVGFAVDKHSSGGVGDKTSLVILPIVAACGVPVAKMSGRGLGHTGGTLDKLESIRGFQVELSRERFRKIAASHQLVLAGQSANLAPADKALYALRDVTGTVSSVPLIASSIMSKKIAAGADAIVLDVKVGDGAFMPDVESARELAQVMINIGKDAGRKMVALISDMNQPLGSAAGLALEVREAIDTLKNQGPEDFREHCLIAATYMLFLAGRGEMKECRALAELALIEGKALAKFREMVAAQGGDVGQVDDPSTLPQAALVEEILIPKAGFLSRVSALSVGWAVLDLGGGRHTKDEAIDHAVGVITHKKIGDPVREGETLFTLYANDADKLAAARRRLEQAYAVSESSVARPPLVYDVLD